MAAAWSQLPAALIVQPLRNRAAPVLYSSMQDRLLTPADGLLAYFIIVGTFALFRHAFRKLRRAF